MGVRFPKQIRKKKKKKGKIIIIIKGKEQKAKNGMHQELLVIIY